MSPSGPIPSQDLAGDHLTDQRDFRLSARKRAKRARGVMLKFAAKEGLIGRAQLCNSSPLGCQVRWGPPSGEWAQLGDEPSASRRPTFCGQTGADRPKRRPADDNYTADWIFYVTRRSGTVCLAGRPSSPPALSADLGPLSFNQKPAASLT